MSLRLTPWAAVCTPLAALALAATPAVAAPTASEQHLLTQFAPDGTVAVIDCAAQPAAPTCVATDGWAYDVTGPAVVDVPQGRQLLGTLAAANGLAAVTKASVLISGPDELRPGDPEPFSGTAADLPDRFFAALSPVGSYVDAAYMRHGSRPAAGETGGRRMQLAGHTTTKQRLLGPASTPLSKRSSITEIAARCQNATGSCEPVAVEEARRLSADPRTAEPGTTYVYSVSALKHAAGKSSTRAATGPKAAAASYVRGAFDTRLRRIPDRLTCAQATSGVAFGVRFASANRKRLSGFVRLVADEGTAQFNSQPFRGSDGSTFSYRARSNDRICGRTIRATYSLRLRDSAGRFGKRQLKTFRVQVGPA